MEDYRITRINLTGHHEEIEHPLAVDFFGNDIYPRDEIYTWNDDVFLIEDLSQDAIDILRHNGANREIA